MARKSNPKPEIQAADPVKLVNGLNTIFTGFSMVFEALAENTELLAKAQQAAQVIAPEPAGKEPDSAEQEAATVTAEAKVQEKPPAVEMEAEPDAVEVQEHQYTQVEVRQKLSALSNGGKRGEVRDLILKYGNGKLSDVPPEKYAELMREAEVL